MNLNNIIADGCGIKFKKKLFNNSICFRYQEQSAVLDSEVANRQIDVAVKDDWFRKRMSRSFESETVPDVREEYDSSGRVVSGNDLTLLPFDDVLKHSEVLARYIHRSVVFKNIFRCTFSKTVVHFHLFLFVIVHYFT